MRRRPGPSIPAIPPSAGRCPLWRRSWACRYLSAPTACCKAVSEGHREFRRIAIYADSENWCTPCGACRQFLAEFSPDMEILCAKAGDRYVSYKLSELLPHTFNY